MPQEDSSAAPTATFTVHVELLSYVNAFAGGPGTGSLELSEQVRPDTTVRMALQQLSRRYPRLDESLWDENNREQLGPHIEVIVNDAILGVAHDLDSRLQPNDHLVLVGQYIGG